MLNITLRGKITAFIITTSVFMLILSSVGFWGARTIGTDGKEIRDNYLTSIVNLSKASESLYTLVIDGKNHIVSPSDAVMIELEAAMDHDEQQARHYLAEFEKTLDAGEETDLFVAFKRAFADYMTIHNRVRELSRVNRDDEAAEISGSEGAAAFARMNTLIDKMMNNNIDGADWAGAEADRHFDMTLTWLTSLSLIMILTSVGLSIVAFRPVFRRLTLLVGSMRDIAEGEGDLRARLQHNQQDELDQVAASFNQFVATIQQLISQVGDSTGKLAASATQLNSSSKGVNVAVQNQLRDVDSITVSMTEMTATVHDVARNATEAADAASHASEETQQGNKVVEQTVEAINHLADDVSQTAEVIHQLEANSNEIGGILDVIRSIADQTNLLALNAAIEAARAGEQGRGFAVVADEVRSLAQRTQESTQEIQTMIERLQGGAKSAVEAMNKGHNQAKQSVDTAAGAGVSLQQITQAVRSITEMNQQIAVASEEQDAVANEINQNMTSISDASRQAATEVEQSLAASETLFTLADDLQQLVARFKY